MQVNQPPVYCFHSPFWNAFMPWKLVPPPPPPPFRSSPFFLCSDHFFMCPSSAHFRFRGDIGRRARAVRIFGRYVVNGNNSLMVQWFGLAAGAEGGDGQECRSGGCTPFPVRVWEPADSDYAMYLCPFEGRPSPCCGPGKGFSGPSVRTIAIWKCVKPRPKIDPATSK